MVVEVGEVSGDGADLGVFDVEAVGDVVGDSLEEAGGVEEVAAYGSGSSFDLVFAFGCGSECCWDCDFDFVEVCDVVDE